MRTIEINVYQFDELSEISKQKAIEECSDYNVDHDWWDCTYEDAERIGLKITEFDLDRNRHCKGEFILSACEVSAKIIQEHGKDCETHKTALQFGIDYDKIKEKYANTGEDDWDEQSEIEDLEGEFLQSILEDYSIMLQSEYEYLISEEAIIETIKANECEFLETGKVR